MVRVGTGADVFGERLREGLCSKGLRAEISWLPKRAEYAPYVVEMPPLPDWAQIAHVNSWLPLRFWPKGIPVVVTVHHLVHDPAYRPYRSHAQALYHRALIRERELRAISKADAVTTVSDYVRETTAHFSGRNEISRIYNWVDFKKFYPAERARRTEASKFRIFMAGSSTRRKGIDLLGAFIEALGPNFEIRYAGGLPKEFIQMPGIVSLGRIGEAELVKEYQTCDAVVSLSRYEGFGYTAVEAMACGKPFLGFITSGLSEVVPRRAGTLVDIGDIHALADELLKLRKTPELGIRMGEAGRSYAERKFNESCIDQYIELYETLLCRFA